MKANDWKFIIRDSASLCSLFNNQSEVMYRVITIAASGILENAFFLTVDGFKCNSAALTYTVRPSARLKYKDWVEFLKKNVW